MRRERRDRGGREREKRGKGRKKVETNRRKGGKEDIT